MFSFFCVSHSSFFFSGLFILLFILLSCYFMFSPLFALFCLYLPSYTYCLTLFFLGLVSSVYTFLFCITYPIIILSFFSPYLLSLPSFLYILFSFFCILYSCLCLLSIVFFWSPIFCVRSLHLSPVCCLLILLSLFCVHWSMFFPFACLLCCIFNTMPYIFFLLSSLSCLFSLHFSLFILPVSDFLLFSSAICILSYMSPLLWHLAVSLSSYFIFCLYSSLFHQLTAKPSGTKFGFGNIPRKLFLLFFHLFKLFYLFCTFQRTYSIFKKGVCSLISSIFRRAKPCFFLLTSFFCSVFWLLSVFSLFCFLSPL